MSSQAMPRAHEAGAQGFIRNTFSAWITRSSASSISSWRCGGHVGIVLSVLMRLHLAWPEVHLPFLAGGLMTPEQYLSLVTMHGTIMVFFVLTTAPQGGFGNYSCPFRLARRTWPSHA